MFDEVRRINKKHTIKLAVCTLVAVGIVLVTMFITVTRPKQPQLCANCHSDISFNNGCKKSSSENITCSECHNHEDENTMIGGVEIKNVIGVEIKDKHCTTESCHPLNKLAAKSVQYKKVTPFEHKTHTGKLAENLKLRCTSCHANLGGERHFMIDMGTCNACHFMSFRIPVYTRDKKPIADCTLCHTHIEKTKNIYEKIFNHDTYEENEKVSCSDCHFKTIQGNGKAEKEGCYQCHTKIDGDVTNTSDIHRIHTEEHKTACTSCHAPISHGWMNNEVDGDAHRSQPADNDFQVQNLMMMGMGGVAIKGEPDPMYLATLNCSACHKDKLFSKVKYQVCNNCHVRGFDKILFEQKRFVSFHLQLLKSLLIKAKRYQDINTDRIIQEAEANYNLIKKDSSFGAHNIKYVKELLGYSIGRLKRIRKQNSDILYLNENL